MHQYILTHAPASMQCIQSELLDRLKEGCYNKICNYRDFSDDIVELEIEEVSIFIVTSSLFCFLTVQMPSDTREFTCQCRKIGSNMLNLIVMNLDRDGPGPKERGLATAAAALQGQG